VSDSKFVTVTGLREARERLGLSIEDAANRLGTNSKRLGRWEREKHIHVDFLLPAEQFYGVKLAKKRPPGLDKAAPTLSIAPMTAANPADVVRAAQEVSEVGALFDTRRAQGAPASELQSLKRLLAGAIRRLLRLGMTDPAAIERTASALFALATGSRDGNLDDEQGGNDAWPSNGGS
jgi:transcriptional regulator with XRE-family HTH domain